MLALNAYGVVMETTKQINISSDSFTDTLHNVISSRPGIIKMRNSSKAWSTDRSCEACGRGLSPNARVTVVQLLNGSVELGAKCSKLLGEIEEDLRAGV